MVTELSKAAEVRALEHDGKYPADFDEEWLGGRRFVVRGRDGDRTKRKQEGLSKVEMDVVLVSGLTMDDPRECTLFYCVDDKNGARRFWIARIDTSIVVIGDKDMGEFRNAPSAFFGTTNSDQLSELQRRVRLVTGIVGWQEKSDPTGVDRDGPEWRLDSVHNFAR